MTLRVNEIFLSIDGECNKWGQGAPSLFVRLQGCNLQCSYCDTPKSQDPDGGRDMTIQEIKQVWLDLAEPRPKITITGGEPLLQENGLHVLINALFPYRARISIETNGTLPLDRFRNIKKPNPDICLVVDWKLGFNIKTDIDNYLSLLETDWVKFVVKDRDMFESAITIAESLRNNGCRARMALSPVMGILEPKQIWVWMKNLRDGGSLNMTLNVQLHKLLDLP